MPSRKESIVKNSFPRLAAYVALAGLTLVACAPPRTETGAEEVTAAGNNRCLPDESETACLARRLVQAEHALATGNTNYDRALALLERRAAGENVDGAVAQLPRTTPPQAPAVVRMVPPTRRVEAVPPVARPAPAPPPQAPAAPAMDPMAGRPPMGLAAPVDPPFFRTPRVGAVGDVGFSGPTPFEGMSVGRSDVTIMLYNVPFDVAIYVDGRLVCPTENGWDYPRIVMSNWRSMCVSPYEPTPTRDIALLLHGQNVRHQVRLVAYGTTTADPVGEPISQVVRHIRPARALNRIIALSGNDF